MASLFTYEKLNELTSGINRKELVFVFDLDGTLVESDVANNLAYHKSYQMKFDMPYSIALKGRITRDRLGKEMNMSPATIDVVANLKQQVYYSYIHCTKLTVMYNLLVYLKGKYPIYLATNSRKNRASLLMTHHGLASYFTGSIYREDIEPRSNKYDALIAKYKLNPSTIILIEDNQLDINNAIQSGVKIDNIMNPQKEVLMNTFTIFKNAYLQSSLQAFYSCLYVGMGNPGNPDYINYLKNQAKDYSHQLLGNCVQMLQNVLLQDLPAIINQIQKPHLVICVVPRAGAITSYTADQLLFMRTVSGVVQALQQRYAIVDGTSYIQRHTSTMTTHLSSTSWQPTGAIAPYPGITKATCHISPNIQGQDVLLIDDIYTPNVNIDEDAIQALIDGGAKSVTFYAIGKV